MIYKIAFASSDGVNIDSHFGAAERFWIAELDTDKEDCDLTGHREVKRACQGGFHETDAFAAILDALSDVSAIVAQRIGPGARQYVKERSIAVYEMPLEIEQAVCLLMEEKQWEVDKWLSHMRN